MTVVRDIFNNGGWLHISIAICVVVLCALCLVAYLGDDFIWSVSCNGCRICCTWYFILLYLMAKAMCVRLMQRMGYSSEKRKNSSCVHKAACWSNKKKVGYKPRRISMEYKLGSGIGMGFTKPIEPTRCRASTVQVTGRLHRARAKKWFGIRGSGLQPVA